MILSGTPFRPRKDEAPAGDEELQMIPRWSMVLAVILFAGMQYVFHFIMPHHKHELFPLRLMMGYAWGSLLASYALLLGYVSRDVRRRGMSAACGCWSALCFREASARWSTFFSVSRCCRAARTASPRSPPTSISVRNASSRWRRYAVSVTAG